MTSYLPAEVVIQKLGGDPRRRMARCPLHDDENPSMSVQDGPNGLLVYCFVCGPTRQADLVAALKARDCWFDRDDRGDNPRYRLNAAAKPDTWPRAQALLRAADISGSQPTAYLQKRGIAARPKCAKLLAPTEVEALTGKRFPAMVVPITNVRGEPQGAQVTWLTANAADKLGVADGKPRRTYGTRKGGFVPLCEPDPTKPLIVGEGVETVLSAMDLTKLPGIATLGALDDLAEVPPCSEVLIAADNDPAGIAGAETLARRLTAAGYCVRIAVPPLPEGYAAAKYDFNDAVADGSDLATYRAVLLKAKKFEAAAPKPEPEPTAASSAQTKTIEERLDVLAKLPLLEFELKREATAKELNIRLSVLDAEIERRRAAIAPSGPAYLKAPKPWDEPVDGAALLDEIYNSLDRYVVMTEAPLVATALWIVHAHAHDAAQCSPFLFINSPTKRCGKTQLMSTVGRLVPKPLQAVSLTAAVLFRAIELWKPTLLIDEADAFIQAQA